MEIKKKLMDYTTWMILGGAVLGAIGGILAGEKQSQETKIENEKLKKELNNSSSTIASLNEQLRIALDENTKEQKIGFDDNRKALSDLIFKAEDQLDKNIETFKFLTGSTSYCVVEVFPDNNGKAKVNLTHIGNYPLYDLRIKIINTTDFDLGKANYTSRGYWIMRSEATPDVDFRQPQYINVPFLSTGESNINVGFISCQRERFNVFSIVVTARNGVWYERFKIMPGESSYDNRAYIILEKDPSNPESGPHNPSSLKVKKETSIPHVFPKLNHRNEPMDWFNGAMF